MSAGPLWLSIIGPHGLAEARRLEAIRTRARATGLSVRWRRMGDKWSGKAGWKFGHIEVMRGREIVGHVVATISTPWAEARTTMDVRRALDELDQLLVPDVESVEVLS
jgi:hypothetical protein